MGQDNITRNKGRSQAYKLDRGGTPAESGPFIGIVVNNVDPTRTGRLQVYIDAFTDGTSTPKIQQSDPSLWRTVRYLSPFYGQTEQGATGGVGQFVDGNPHAYGMWFTVPDLNTQVVCFFINGDPDQGFYVGCLPTIGLTHMIPAIGAVKDGFYKIDSSSQQTYLEGSPQLPVIEINSGNPLISNNPKFYKSPKPVHNIVAAELFQQGLIKDVIRGPINSTSQRESPSRVFGFSTPGRPIYQGGEEQTSKANLEQSNTNETDLKVVGRKGGHTFVMDDGDVEDNNRLIRIRSSAGHQITMSDDGECFFIIHANGLTWLEFGKEGTVDLYSQNSVNVRTKGTLNLHADNDINIFAGKQLNIKSGTKTQLDSDGSMVFYSTDSMTLYSKNSIGIKSGDATNIESNSGSWDGGFNLTFEGGKIKLNSGGAASVSDPDPLTVTQLDDTKFVANEGWTIESGALKSIVTRAPTHEPYPYHNKGTSDTSDLDAEDQGQFL